MQKSGGPSRLRGWRVVFLTLLGLLANIEPVGAQYYKVGDIIQNFTLYARRPFTNLAGWVFLPGAPVRLTDFAGYVVFAEFFDPT